LTYQFKAFVDLQYFLKQFCCFSLIKLHIVQGVNNVQICLIPAFSSYTIKLGRCHPNVCTAETGSQLLTATSYKQNTTALPNFYRLLSVNNHTFLLQLHSPSSRLFDLFRRRVHLSRSKMRSAGRDVEPLSARLRGKG
jgi:hypothetical protein